MYISIAVCFYHQFCAGIGALFQQVSSMSEDDFFKWLKQRGVSDKDCKTLSGKMHRKCCSQ